MIGLGKKYQENSEQKIEKITLDNNLNKIILTSGKYNLEILIGVNKYNFDNISLSYVKLDENNQPISISHLDHDENTHQLNKTDINI